MNNTKGKVRLSKTDLQIKKNENKMDVSLVPSNQLKIIIILELRTEQ